MLKLISLSPAVAEHFGELSGKDGAEWFASHDPVDARLGSGGGTVHLLREAWRSCGGGLSMREWLEQESGIVLHAGGQSRRLPAYAAEGKALIPVPVFRWARGQRIDQTLIDLQMPFLQRILAGAAGPGHWLIASGDVLLHADHLPTRLPGADVVALAMWGDPEQASHHGVFFTPRNDSAQLRFMLQKPDLETIRSAGLEHYFLLDVGVWVLNARALAALIEQSIDPVRAAPSAVAAACITDDRWATAALREFDLYGEFGLGLGTRPTMESPATAHLSAALVALDGGKFYHFGSGPDLLHSALKLQNRVIDQRRISTSGIKPHPSLFVQSSRVAAGVLSERNSRIWIENCRLGSGWILSSEHILTGIDGDDWELGLAPGQCVEVMPLKSGGNVLRVYGFTDLFRGPVGAATTQYCGGALADWLAARGLSMADLDLDADGDIQRAALFPVVPAAPPAELLAWLLHGGDHAVRELFLSLRRVSAEDLAREADLLAQQARRRANLLASLPVLAANAHRSVFHLLDLEHLAPLYAESGAALPTQRPDPQQQLFAYLHDAMFRAGVARSRGESVQAEEGNAFAALRTAMIESAREQPVKPQRDCLEDQIIWARSPVRLDLAGGWSDTPPYCFVKGGKVVNLAVELNGQPPIQVFIRPRREGGIRLRSIDLGVSQEIASFDDLRSYAEIGSGFAIPKAALALCGFLPEFHAGKMGTDLGAFLDDFGGGLEISLLCAVPKGSGLGTSSILAATILGAISEFCQLGWDVYTIAQRVLVLEQMLTSGGGWQDQYGGICRGLKYLETAPGLQQIPRICWLDDHLFSDPAYRGNVLLYYTGITRTAKNVLGEIVRGMFLNSGPRLAILDRIAQHAADLQGSIQEGDYAAVGEGVRHSWQLNQALDPGTNTPEIDTIMRAVDPWLAGGKLLGAGGGGYLLLLAKDGDAARRIKEYLIANPPNPRARFVGLSLSASGLQVTRS